MMSQVLIIVLTAIVMTPVLHILCRVLDMPEFKIVKLFDTRWLHNGWLMNGVLKVVKENYCAIIIALNNICEETHEPEALAISKALSK